MKKKKNFCIVALTVTMLALTGCGNSAELESLKVTDSEKDAIIAEKDSQIADLNNKITELNATITDLQEQIETLQSDIEGLSSKVSDNDNEGEYKYLDGVTSLKPMTPEEKEAAESKAMDDFLNTTPVVNDKEVTIENCEVSIGTNGYPVYGTQSNPLTVKPDVSQLKSGDQYWFRTWSGEVVLEIYSNADFW